MKVDLNQKFSTADVAKLLGSKDDSVNRQLRVTKAGEAYLSDEVGNLNTDDLAFRLETWDAGKDYVGHKAAADQAFVARVEKTLRLNWPNPTSSYIDLF